MRSNSMWIALLLGMAMASGPAFAFEENPDLQYEKEVRLAQANLESQQYNEAIRGFTRANRLKADRSPDCFWGIALSYFELGAYPIAIDHCNQALKYASDDSLRARAHNLKGSALLELAGEKNGALADAEHEFRAALELKPNPPLPVLHFSLGTLLLKEGRKADGIAELQTYLQLEPQGKFSSKARQAIEGAHQAPASTPGVSPSTRAPDFSLRSMQGEEISSKTLAGKVVLLDFWATWCGPCRMALPGLRKLYQKFSTDRRFVMISISSDRNASAWRDFVRNSQVTWPQYLDQDYRINRLFGVRGFPTYVLIGPDGILRRRFSGWGSNQDRFLEEEIRRSLDSLTTKSQ